MTHNELYRLTDNLNSIALKGIEEYKVGTLCTFPLYTYGILNINRHESLIRHLIMMLARCITIRNKFEVTGAAEIVCYCSRPMAIGRSDHLKNFRKVTDMLKNKVLIVGTAMEGITIKNFGSIFLPFAWNYELKKIVKNKELRWGLIRNLYSAYIDFLEYIRFEKKQEVIPKGLLLLEEEIPSAQLIRQYFSSRGRTTVVLQHGIYDGQSPKDKYYLDYWGCDFMLAYSQYSLELINELGGYPGETRVLGMFHYIDCPIKERKIREIKKIGIFLDALKRERDIQLKMIYIVADVAKEFDAEVYVKLHPSCDADDLEFYEKQTLHLRIKKFYCKEITSIDLEKEIDVFICRNTTCFLEAIYQMIPAFIFKHEPVLYRNIRQKVYFQSKEELKELCDMVVGDNVEKELRKIKQYISGCDNPKGIYEKFFDEVGWI